MFRYDILNKFISERNYKNYLEIGVHDRNGCFNKINCENKICVDPDINAKADFVMTSDRFFEQNVKKFDIIFIDGLHEGHQVYKDIQNSLKVLNTGGIIMCHDCSPNSVQESKDYEDFPLEDYGKYSWYGDSWKGFVKYRFESNYLCYTINTDSGCGIIDTLNKSNVQKRFISIGELTYSDLDKNRKIFLGIV